MTVIDTERPETERPRRDLLVARWAWDETGEPVSSFYAEMFWLPTIGPTSLWLLRRLNAYLTNRDQALVDVWTIGRELGLFTPGSRTILGRHNPVERSADRLCQFGLARLDPQNGVTYVRTLVPRISDRARDRLPAHLQSLLSAHGDEVRT